MSSTQHVSRQFESVDSIVKYLRQPSPEVVSSTTSTTIGSHTRISPEKIKKEKEQIDSLVNVKVLPSGRVRYGPITVNPRKQPSKTLFTGRRSKYEVLAGDEEEKRRVRRDRNRVAATRCREKRDNVLSQLENDHNQQLQHYSYLNKIIRELEERKQYLHTLLSDHTAFCLQPINPASSPAQPLLVFGDTAFLSSISEPPAPQLPPPPPSRSQLLQHEQENCSHFVHSTSHLTNSAYKTDPFVFPDQQTLSMTSSSLDRLLNDLPSPNAFTDSNNLPFPHTQSGLYNSATGTFTCAQQHSSSSEDDSLPSTRKNHFVY